MRFNEEVLELNDHLDRLNASLGLKTVAGDWRLRALVFYYIDIGKTQHRDGSYLFFYKTGLWVRY